MPKYLTPSGITCAADQAFAGGTLRPGYSEIVDDGEYVGFSLALRDSAPRGSVFLNDAPEGSLDAAVKAAIEEAAKDAGIKPSDWLTNKDQRSLEKFIGEVAAKFVGGFTGQGIAKAFSMDAQVKTEVDRAEAAHDAKFAFMGDRAPKFDRALAETIARSRARSDGARQLRDAALTAARIPGVSVTLSHLSDQAENQLASAQRKHSDQRGKAWKGGDGASIRDAARRARVGS